MRKTDSPRWGDLGRRRQNWHLSPGRSHSRAWVQIPSPRGLCTLLLNLGKNLHPTWVSPLVSYVFSFLSQLLFCHPTTKSSFSTLNHVGFYPNHLQTSVCTDFVQSSGHRKYREFKAVSVLTPLRMQLAGEETYTQEVWLYPVKWEPKG